MPLTALIAVPTGGALYAYATVLFVTRARHLTGDARARARRQARWTAVATGLALLALGLAMRIGTS